MRKARTRRRTKKGGSLSKWLKSMIKGKQKVPVATAYSTARFPRPGQTSQLASALQRQVIQDGYATGANTYVPSQASKPLARALQQQVRNNVLSQSRGQATQGTRKIGTRVYATNSTTARSRPRRSTSSPSSGNMWAAPRSPRSSRRSSDDGLDGWGEDWKHGYQGDENDREGWIDDLERRNAAMHRDIVATRLEVEALMDKMNRRHK